MLPVLFGLSPVRADHNLKKIDLLSNTALEQLEYIKPKVNYKLNYGLVFGDRFLKKFGKYSYNTKTNKLTIGVK